MAKEAVNPKLDLSKLSVPDARLEELKQLFPEAVTEGKVDFVRLRQMLGDAVDTRKEKYGLSWAGKSEAIQTLQAPAIGTLTPQPKESVNFDTSENLIIEGDNLEVLKLLQKSYYGKIKMIYIDPPYNTGNEFIYPDNFKEGLEDYLRYSGQTSDEGLKLSTNTEANGRYHSKWLNMMYPRLFLAKNLLQQDGVIFVSIDDNEVHNLRGAMNEIFGEENFIDCIIWKKRYGGGAKEKYLVSLHEYVLVYAKAKASVDELFIPLDQESIDRYYKQKDENYEIRGAYRTHPLEATKSMGERKNLVYPIKAPDGSDVLPKRQWLWSKERTQAALDNNEIEFIKSKDGWTVHTKQYLKDANGEMRKAKAFSVIDDVYTQHGTNEIIEIFGDAQIFSFPKPTSLISKLVEIATSSEKEDIVLDMFAGCGSTAASVIGVNRKDNGNRKYLLVQLPEPCEAETSAAKAGFQNISQICRERVRRVVKKISDERSKTPKLDQKPIDLGFKAFTLTSSNFKEWQPEKTGTSEEALAKQLRLHIENVKDQRTALDIAYEIVLKLGYELSVALEEIQVNKQSVYSVAGGEFLLCVEKQIKPETLREMMKRKPKRIVCLDVAFSGNDELKTNIVLEMQSHEIEFHTV